jgi:hypothetical protein
MQQAMQMRDWSDQMTDRNQKRQDEQAIRDALRETGGDIEKALPKLRQASPTFALAIEKELTERKRVALQQQSAELERNQRVMQYVGQVLNGVNDDVTYKAAVDAIHRTHDQLQIPRIAFPETYDKKHVEGLRSQALTVQQQIENTYRKATLEATGGANTDYGRALSRYARGAGKTVETLTWDEEEKFRAEWDAVNNNVSKGQGTEYERALLRYAKQVQGTGIKSLDDVPWHLERTFATQEWPKVNGGGRGSSTSKTDDDKQLDQDWREYQEWLKDERERLGRSVDGERPMAFDDWRAEFKQRGPNVPTGTFEVERPTSGARGVAQREGYVEGGRTVAPQGSAPSLAATPRTTNDPRKELEQLVAKFKAEKDPAKQEQIKTRMAELRREVGRID